MSVIDIRRHLFSCEVWIPSHFRELAMIKDVAAIGEIGLDYSHSPETVEIQKELLIFELSLARETGLPVNIHCRQAHKDMLDIIRGDTGSELKGIVHGFSGDAEELSDWLNLGFYISVGMRGLVINENPSLATTIGEIPLDRLLTETDAAARGQIAGPADVILVVHKLASLRGTSDGEIGNITTANLKRLLDKK